MADGTTREIADVWFANSPTYTRPDTPVVLSAAAAALPELSGYGLMRDLQSAATLDAPLLTDVQALVADIAQSPALTLAAIKTLMLEWSGSTAVDPNSRGGFIDGAGLKTTSNLLWDAAISVQEAWNSAYDGIVARLALQAGYAMLEMTDYRPMRDFQLAARMDTEAQASRHGFQPSNERRPRKCPRRLERSGSRRQDFLRNNVKSTMSMSGKI